MTLVSRTPSAMVGSGQCSRTRSSGSMAGPTRSNDTPLARWAAAGAKTSRPWKLVLTTGIRYAGSVSSRAARRADSRVDDRDVEPDRQVRQRAPEEQCAVADRVLPDLVADVDDPGFGCDADDHAGTDRGRRIAEAEVGQQCDQRAWHSPHA